MIYIRKTGRTSETFLTAYSYSLSVKSNWNSFKKYSFLFTFAHCYAQLVKKKQSKTKQKPQQLNHYHEFRVFIARND